jgi:hypothetical protein
MTQLRRLHRTRSLRVLLGLIAIFVTLAAVSAQARFAQQDKLVGTGAVGNAQQGLSVALSADGNTAIVGGRFDNGDAGAAWVFVRAAGVWTQQAKLVGTGASGSARQGASVGLSADGNTAMVGGPEDNNGAGAAWVFVRAGGVWTQQGGKLVGTGAAPSSLGLGQGFSVALSADGKTAIVGAPDDNLLAGAAWVFVRAGGVWSQQAGKLVGSGAFGPAQQGTSVALSADGNIAIVGGPFDSAFSGAVWVFIRSGAMWTQQAKLADPIAGGARQGLSVALSTDGNTALVGGPFDSARAGAAWVYTRSGGVWTQQGPKLVGTGAVANDLQGTSVALAGDGNTAIVGGPGDNNEAGAAWVFVRRSGVWTQLGIELVGSGAVGPLPARQGTSVALSGDGYTAIIGGPLDNSAVGAAWVFGQPGITAINPTAGTVAGGTGVTIVGQNFFDVTGVTFGGVPATNVTAVDANTVLATTPPHTGGPVSVFLSTRTGGDRARHAYTYQRQPTAVQLTSTPNPSTSGQSVTFTALVIAGSGGAASGSVVFTDGTQPLATVTLRNGLARFSTNGLALGGHRIRARFISNGMFEGSSSHLRQLVRN